MPTDCQTALAKLRSLRNSLFEGVTELQTRACVASVQGRADLSSQYSLQAVALTRETVRLRQAEEAIRARLPGAATAAECAALAGHARGAVQELRAAPDVLARTTSLLIILRCLPALAPERKADAG